VRTIAAVNHVQDPVAGIGVNHAREDDEFDGIENDCPVGLGRGFTIQPSSFGTMKKMYNRS
jgi:hypothetical protein